MSRIVRENYPVAVPPEDLRADFPAGATVRVTVEPAQAPPERALSLDELWRDASRPLQDVRGGRRRGAADAR